MRTSMDMTMYGCEKEVQSTCYPSFRRYVINVSRVPENGEWVGVDVGGGGGYLHKKLRGKAKKLTRIGAAFHFKIKSQLKLTRPECFEAAGRLAWPKR